MEIMRKRALKISMGDYESFDTDAFIKASHQDIGFTDEEWLGLTETQREEQLIRLQALVGAELDAALSEDIADAQILTGNRKSFIHRITNGK